jgi:superfamily II DNA or RNA helicase
MTSSQSSEYRRTRRFDWKKVDSRVTKAMLVHAYQVKEQHDDVERLHKCDQAALAKQAGRTFGQPPAPTHFDHGMVEVLREFWLPRASAKEIDQLTLMVQARLSDSVKMRKLSTKDSKIAFIRYRKNTVNLRTNIRKSFLAAHKSDHLLPKTPKGSAESPSSWVPLKGAGLSPRTPYPHQKEAWKQLDRLMLSNHPSGSIVLPTGSGKTDTIAVWLLRQMQKNPDLRILWITHQQELISQAILRLQDLATTAPADFSRRARRIYGGASSPSTLGEESLDVAAITFQSLRGVSSSPGNPLDSFLERPTIVVVDEAHHAGSPTYDQILHRLAEHTHVKAMIGLTATPYPSSLLARSRFEAHFPTRIIEVEREPLIAARILAQPVLTVVNTGTAIRLTTAEQASAVSSDLPPNALKRLNELERNEIVVKTWMDDRFRWGKTLVFATNIDHAEELYELFKTEKVPAMVLHSRSEESANGILQRFSSFMEPCVLVSVGMLTEGVDLPDAKTAILARPTSSRILMQQMIGRVLRGPKAGGDAEANVIYLRDQWLNFGDVIEPEEAMGGIIREPKGPRNPDDRPLPAVLVDDEGDEIPPDAAAQIQRLFDQLRASANLEDDDPSNDRSTDPLLSTSRLCGYYNLPDRSVPVFEHQRDAFTALLADCIEFDLRGTPLLQYFDGLPSPYPTQRTLRELVDYSREFEEPPAFSTLNAEVGPEVAARAVVGAGPLTIAERSRIVREVFDSTIARPAYPSLAHFEEAVDAEVRRLSSGERRLSPERQITEFPSPSKLLPRFDRDLIPLTDLAVETAQSILKPEHAKRLDHIPAVEWTRDVNRHTWGHWSIALHGKNSGQQSIRINRMLRTSPKAVPDEVIAYLIYHELLHHLLPGQGHDAEFRLLEELWPDSSQMDLFFDTLHENWNLDPKNYTSDEA